MQQQTAEQVAARVRKLLRLATSPNPNEAASAAAKAQALIDEHKLTNAMLELDTGEEAPQEDIQDFRRKGAPLDTNSSTWRGRLAMVICANNACVAYKAGGSLHIVGRPTDADSVRYLYAYLSDEVNRLAALNAKGCGRVWANNYRLGVVDTIALKLREERSRLRHQAAEEASRSGGRALVRLNTALAKIEGRGVEVDKWAKRELGLRTSRGSSARTHHGAREQGRQDGKSIRVGDGGPGLGSGRKLLN